MVYVPPEILKIILKLRSKLAFKDRIAYLEKIIYLPPPLELFDRRMTIYCYAERIGNFELSRMIIESEILMAMTQTFHMYKYNQWGCRHDLVHFYHTLQYDEEGYAVHDIINIVD
jgi:hypothetical protein